MRNSGFMRLLLLIVLAVGGVIAVFFLTDIGTFQLTGEETSKVFELEQYESISFSGAGTLTLKTGNERSLRITTDKNLLEKINVDQEGEDVTVAFERIDFVRSLKLEREDIAFELTTPNIESLTLSGTFALETDGEVTSDEIILSSTGRLDGDLTIYTNNLGMSFGGQGTLTIGGTVLEETALSASGNGTFMVEDLNTDLVTIKANGSHTIALGSPEALQTELNGVNKITFIETPTELSTKTQGQSTVQLKSLTPEESEETPIEE